MKFKKNSELDATLVHAASIGLFVPCAIGLGMTPNEAYGRADWLKKQDGEYIKEVAEKVVALEKKNRVVDKKGICEQCGEEIQRAASGKYWEHVNSSPRHPATPKKGVKNAITVQKEQSGNFRINIQHFDH